ncbi:MAG: methyltransferase family protein [Actinomycetota bacterium]
MRSVAGAAAASIAFAVLAPGTVVGLAPWLVARWFPEPVLPAAIRPVGWLLVIPGLAVLADSFIRFVRARGTPAPPAPTEHLVVAGLYRWVRNPMYVAIVATLVGEALLYARAAVLAYAAAVWVAFHLFVVLYEEPALARRFGSGYEDYRRRVGRWVPRR